MYQPSETDLARTSAVDIVRVTEDLRVRGHSVLDAVLAPALLAALDEEARRLCARPPGPDDGTVVCADDRGRVLSLHHLDRRSDLLFDLMRLPGLVGLAEALLTRRCVPFLSEYFAKPTSSTQPSPPHQDQIFYRDHFGDELAVTFWLPLDDVGTDDAVLQYATRQPAVGELLPHRESRIANFGAELRESDDVEYVDAPVRAGGLVAHHSYAVHRSGPLRSRRPRRAFALNYRCSPYRQSLRPWTGS